MPTNIIRSPRVAAPTQPAQSEDDEPAMTPQQVATTPTPTGTTGGLIPQQGGEWWTKQAQPVQWSADPQERTQQTMQETDRRWQAHVLEQNPFTFSNAIPATPTQLYAHGAQLANQEYQQQAIAARAQKRDETEAYNSKTLADYLGRGVQHYVDPASGRVVPVVDPQGRTLFHPTDWEEAVHPKTGQPVLMKRDQYGQRQFKDMPVVPGLDPTDDKLYFKTPTGEMREAGNIADMISSPNYNVAKTALAANKRRVQAVHQQALAPMKELVDQTNESLKAAQDQRDELTKQLAQATSLRDENVDDPAKSAGYDATATQLKTQLDNLNQQIGPKGALNMTAAAARRHYDVARRQAVMDVYKAQNDEIAARLQAQGKDPATDPTYQANVGMMNEVGKSLGQAQAVAPAAQTAPPPPLELSEPANLMRQGQKSVGGVSLATLAQRFGSGEGPVNPSSLLAIKQRVDEIGETLSNPQTKISGKLTKSLQDQQDYLGQLYSQRFARLSPDEQARVTKTIADQKTSAAGAFGRSAVSQAPGIAGAIAGGEAGAAAGAFGGPLAPATVPAGAAIGALVGSILADRGARKLAEKVAPEAYSKFQDLSAKDWEQHTMAVTGGQAAGMLAAFRPSNPAMAVRQLSALTKLAKGQTLSAGEQAAAKALAVQAGLAGGTAVAAPLIQGEKVDPMQALSAAAQMMLFGESRFGGKGKGSPGAPKPGEKPPLTPEQTAAEAEFQKKLAEPESPPAEPVAPEAPKPEPTRTAEESAQVFEPALKEGAVPPAKSAAESAEVFAQEIQKRAEEAGLTPEEKAHLDALLKESEPLKASEDESFVPAPETLSQEPLEPSGAKTPTARETTEPAPATPPPDVQIGNKDAAAAAADKIIMEQNRALRAKHGSEAFPNIEDNPNRPAGQRALAKGVREGRPPIETDPAKIAEDRKQYDRLQAVLRRRKDYGSEAYNKLWQQSEDIKNRHGGMPPGEVSAGGARPESVSGQPSTEETTNATQARQQPENGQLQHPRTPSGSAVPENVGEVRPEESAGAGGGNRPVESPRGIPAPREGGKQGQGAKGAPEGAAAVREEVKPTKEPWQMTQEDYVASRIDSARNDPNDPNHKYFENYSRLRRAGEWEKSVTGKFENEWKDSWDAAVREGKPVAEKPLWQMTKSEFEKETGNSASEHELHVKNALARGDAVPPDVLKDYPNLVPQAPDLKPPAQMKRPELRAELAAAGVKDIAGTPLEDANAAQLMNAVGKLRRGQLDEPVRTAEISSYAKKRMEGEARAKFDSTYQRLMRGAADKKAEIASEYTPEEAKRALEQLNAAPGFDADAKAALEARAAESPIRTTDKIIAALQKAKIHKPGELAAATPLSLAHDAALDLAILGIKAGRAVADVIKIAVQRFKARYPGATDEDVARLTKAIQDAHGTPPEPPARAKAPTNLLEKASAKIREIKDTSSLKDAITAQRDAVDNAAGTAAAESRSEVSEALARAEPDKKLQSVADDALRFFIEADDGNATKLKEMRAKVANSEKVNPKWQAQALKAIDYALANGDKLKDAAERFRRITGQQLDYEKAVGLPTVEAKNYVPRYQDVDEAGLLEPKGGNLSGSQNRKVRTHETMADSLAAGVDPKSLSSVDSLTNRIRAGHTDAGLKAWHHAFYDMKDASGTPLAVKPGKVERADGSSYFQAPDGYKLKLAHGEPVAIKKEFSRIYDAMTEPNWFSQHPEGLTLQEINGFAKSAMLAADTFHLGRLALRSSMLNLSNGVIGPRFREGLMLSNHSPAEIARMGESGEIPKADVPRLVENKRIMDTLIENGYNMGRISDALHQELMQKIPGLGKINKFIFDRFQRGAMADAGVMEYRRLKESNPDMSEQEAARTVAKELNTLFGNFGRQGLFKSATAQAMARFAALAPQWNEGLIRSEVGGAAQTAKYLAQRATGKPATMGIRGRNFLTTAASLFVASQLMNLVSRGKPTWENPEESTEAKMSGWIPDAIGKSAGFFFNPMGLTAETSHLLMKNFERSGNVHEATRDYLRSRESALARMADTYFTGEDPLGREIPKDQIWAGIAKAGAPVPISGGAIARAGKAAIAKAEGEPVNTEKYPGEFQKQAMQSFGMRTDAAPSPERRIADLAHEFNKAHGKEDAGPRTVSDFSDLNAALRRGNQADVKSAIDGLLEKRSAEDLEKYYRQWQSRTFTGSHKNEAEFIRGLNAEQRQQYAKARAERRQLGEMALRAIRAIPPGKRAGPFAPAP